MKFLFELVECVCLFNFISCTITLNTSTKKPNPVEDYYVNYDYDLVPAGNGTGRVPLPPIGESLILPNPLVPDGQGSPASVGGPKEALLIEEIMPKIELPDDSLADADLRERDFIDNLMYVYCGSNPKPGKFYGPEIIIVGSVLSCAPQLLTIILVLLKKKNNTRREMHNTFLILMGFLLISNLMFMLGIYSTKNPIKCQMIGLLLHFLHLVTAGWVFVYVLHIYTRFRPIDPQKLRIIDIGCCVAAAIFTLLSYVVSPYSYETKKFCFISVQKGMILNFMVPVSALILATTGFCLNGIRKVNLELWKLEVTNSADSLNALRHEIDFSDEKRQDSSPIDNDVISLRECKRSLRTLCIIETCYDIVWFIAVVALENLTFSNTMSVVFSASSIILNWYIFAKTKSLLPSLITNRLIIEESIITIEPEKIIPTPIMVPTKDTSSSDNIPLLVNAETELREIVVRQDYISTISS